MFGRVADMLGRKRIYGFEVLVLAAGFIACAFAPNILWLIGLRFAAALLTTHLSHGALTIRISKNSSPRSSGALRGPHAQSGLRRYYTNNWPHEPLIANEPSPGAPGTSWDLG